MVAGLQQVRLSLSAVESELPNTNKLVSGVAAFRAKTHIRVVARLISVPQLLNRHHLRRCRSSIRQTIYPEYSGRSSVG